MEQTITCIVCPVGCQLRATLDKGEVVSVNGQGCNRGLAYAKQECTHPTRMVTAVIAVEGHKTPLSVKTAAPIPKEKILECMAAIQEAKPTPPIEAGQVICENICGTGVPVIATKALP